MDNLELVTNSENTQHGYDNGLYHSKHRRIEIKVYLKANGAYVDTYPSIRQAAVTLKINRKTLSSILFDNKPNNTEYDFKPILDAEGQTTIKSAAA